MQSKFVFELSTFVSILAISVACFGLLGILMYTVKTRTREICIRKILGARTGSLLAILSREYVLLIVIASCIVLPVVWILHNLALQDLANRAHLGIADVALCLGVMLLLGCTTILSQVVKTARVSPAETLHDE